MCKNHRVPHFAMLMLLCSASTANAVWLNETNSPLEVDYAALQFPASIVAPANTFTSSVYGRIFELGVTEAGGTHPSVAANVGYGPYGSDPRTSGGWIWYSTFYNLQVGNDDEYQQQLLTPAFNGTYSYTYRFSVNGGLDWTAADLDGAGSNVGLTFDPNHLGVLTVFGGLDQPDVPEPPGLLLAALACCGLLAMQLRQRWG